MDMKVAIGTWEAPPMYSGPSYSISGLVEGLSDHIQVIAIVPQFAGFKEKPKLKVQKLNTIKIPIIQVSLFALRANLAVKKLSVDIIHDNGILAFTNFSPFVEIWRHGNEYFPGSSKYKYYLSLYREKLTLLGIRKADYITPISSQAANELVTKYSISPSRIEVIPVGVNAKFFKPTSRFSKSIKTTRTNLLYVGALTKRKNVNSLLYALKTLIKENLDIFLNIVGEGEEKEYLQTLCNNLKLNLHVKFLGNVSDETLLKLYNSNDFLVHPSYKEGFGRTLIEALACETPVITTPTGIHKIIQKNDLGVVTKGFTYTNLAFAMKQAIDNKDKFKNLRKFVLENYDWPLIIKKMLKFYQKILEDS